jgi:kynureninase
MSACEDRAAARRRDDADPLSALRAEFAMPPWPGGAHPEWAYLAGNSLGPMPRAARTAVNDELDTWSRLAVEGWFDGSAPWLEVAGSLRPALARLVGASPGEVAVTGSLTVDLHLLLASFYRPTTARRRILIEDTAFPSDSHVVRSQAVLHDLDPEDTVIRVAPRDGEATLRVEDVVAAIERAGDTLAVVLLGAVNYLTGELLPVRELTDAAHGVGAICGWDLAHAVGNVPVALHDDDVDFAAWCHYKYVNAGPGAPAGIFVHERHWRDAAPFRLAGWWGVDPAERFRMAPEFVPREGAEGWALSTPPILAYAPLRASLELFDRVGITALRERSVHLTSFLEGLLDEVAASRRLEVITPRDPARRGCQLSVAVARAGALAKRLRLEHGVVCDVRRPDVVRFAPAPLYSSFEDCRRAAAALAEVCERR